MQNSSRRPAEAATSRMAPLTNLPVFFDLAGRSCVVAGGSPGAAWKAELLASAGANVTIWAEEPGAEILALLERGPSAGSIMLQRRPWSADALAGTALAVIDCEEATEAETFRAAARAAGVPVNTVDKPDTCDFQFGAIVNRSPVVIGISTDGVAPILGQAIRRRIEVLLPASLSGWAAAARQLQEQVVARLRPGLAVRRFWERFAEAAFGPAKTTDEIIWQAAQLLDDAATGLNPQVGHVTLVGAGPGDPGLLTINAVRALQAADVILFDDLVSEGVLELARREARRMLVGKRGDRPSCDQNDITATMLALALQGRRVVRLKSGDPMVFGRAGEEIAALEKAGVPVSVVPGVTAALALAAAARCSLTQRGVANTLTLVTGRDRHGDLPPDLNWDALSAPDCTTVVYMGARTAPKFARKLLERDMPAGTPLLVAANLSRPDQWIWRGTLGDLATGDPLPQDRPLLIGIGQSLSRKIQETGCLGVGDRRCHAEG